MTLPVIASNKRGRSLKKRMEFPTNPMLYPRAGFSTCGVNWRSSAVAISTPSKRTAHPDVFGRSIAFGKPVYVTNLSFTFINFSTALFFKNESSF
jgi:hypothetical protein